MFGRYPAINVFIPSHLVPIEESDVVHLCHWILNQQRSRRRHLRQVRLGIPGETKHARTMATNGDELSLSSKVDLWRYPWGYLEVKDKGKFTKGMGFLQGFHKHQPQSRGQRDKTNDKNLQDVFLTDLVLARIFESLRDILTFNVFFLNIPSRKFWRKNVSRIYGGLLYNREVTIIQQTWRCPCHFTTGPTCGYGPKNCAGKHQSWEVLIRDVALSSSWKSYTWFAVKSTICRSFSQTCLPLNQSSEY